MSNDWIDKYKPQKIDDVVGDNQTINQIEMWLTNFYSNKVYCVKKKNIEFIKIRELSYYSPSCCINGYVCFTFTCSNC